MNTRKLITSMAAAVMLSTGLAGVGTAMTNQPAQAATQSGSSISIRRRSVTATVNSDKPQLIAYDPSTNKFVKALDSTYVKGQTIPVYYAITATSTANGTSQNVTFYFLENRTVDGKSCMILIPSTSVTPASTVPTAEEFQKTAENDAKTIQDEKLTVIAEPKLNVTKIDANELECTVTVALPPVVTLGEYKGIHIEKKPVEVTEQDVETEINKQLNNHATLLVKEDAASLNDTVIIDFKGYIDDIPFDGGEAKGYELKLGSNAFIPGFEDQLIGIKADEEREITVTFPTNYVENLAGKEAKFVVKCHEVKQTSLPTLGDEFVKELELENIETVDQYIS